jgi:hypothetical protein
MRKLVIGAAAIALAAGSAFADPGKGGGKGNGGGEGGKGAAAAHKDHGGSGGKDKGKGNGGDRGPSMKADKGERGPSMRAEKSDRGGGKSDRGWAKADKSERGQSMRADKGDNGAERRAERGRDENKRDVRFEGGNERVVRDDRKDRRWDDDDFFDRDDRGLVQGCPPGLAKKNNGCMPPGLAKQRDGDWRTVSYRPDWFGYSDLNDGRYFYDDGFLYRLGNQGSVLGFVPLLGGALSVGNPWPSYYEPNPVPDYYGRYYNLGSPDSYRYADDVLYRVDPQTDTISGIIALLTGDQFAVGQPMPMGYDVYNVPYDYRDRFVDGPNAYYRYADGYVYEVDPTTQLIEAVIELLA